MSLSEMVAPFLLAWFACWTTAVWLTVRRAVASDRPCLHRFCPQCGFDIAARLAKPDSVSLARAVATVVDAPSAAALGSLPSDLLRRGWSRTVQPAADAAGRPVLSDSPDARYFTIWAAANRAFSPGSLLWESFYRGLQAVLLERYGRITVQRWNRDRQRTQNEVVAVAEEAERMMGQDTK